MVKQVRYTRVQWGRAEWEVLFKVYNVKECHTWKAPEQTLPYFHGESPKCHSPIRSLLLRAAASAAAAAAGETKVSNEF